MDFWGNIKQRARGAPEQIKSDAKGVARAGKRSSFLRRELRRERRLRSRSKAPRTELDGDVGSYGTQFADKVSYESERIPFELDEAMRKAQKDNPFI